MESEEPWLDLLAKKIVGEKVLTSACSLCNELFSAVYQRGAKDILLDSTNGREIEKKCHLLREALEQNGITEKFSNEDLCKLAHKVFRIKLLRGV